MHRRRATWFLAYGVLAGMLMPTCAPAGEVQLADGTVLRGTIRPQQSLALASQRNAGELTTYPIIATVTPLRRYFVPTRLVAELNNNSDLDRFETFKLSQRKSRFSTQVQSLGIPTEIGEWDEFGRRRLVFRVKDRTVNVYQWVTQLTPHQATVVAQGLGWSHGIATNAISPQVLDSWLRRVTKDDLLDDRLAIARFYLQANMFKQARGELRNVRADFPDEKTRIASLQARLDELVGQKILDELKRRRANGQHRLFRKALQSFPVDQLSATLRRQVRELIEQDRQRTDRVNTARRLVTEQLAAVSKTKTRQQLEPLVAEIVAGLDAESVSRVDAFLELSDDATLDASQKLALAGSGWLTGSRNAVTMVRDTVSLYRARELLLAATRADRAELPGLLSRLESLEGISPARIALLIEELPPITPTPEIQPGTATKIEPTANRPGYWVLLPPEYNPNHRYPMLVTLHAAAGLPRKSINWWAGTPEKPRPARQRGYIVVAPELPGVARPGTQSDGKSTSQQMDLQIGPKLHQAVRRVVVDSRRRFRVDSDRIYLAGHGQGADAAFEIGMSHPEWFAAVIPIAGRMTEYCTYYWHNADRVAWYVVNGELDRVRVEHNSFGLNRMLRHRFPMIYCEYAGRGYESFAEELGAIFDWLPRHTRSQEPREFQAGTLRSTDNRFHWVEMRSLPLGETRGRKTRPLRLTAKITVGNSIHVNSAARATTLWLSPELVDFEKRVQVTVNGRRGKSQFLKPSISDMIDDFRNRADREKLYWTRLDIE
jgi:predicted esterase